VAKVPAAALRSGGGCLARAGAELAARPAGTIRLVSVGAPRRFL